MIELNHFGIWYGLVKHVTHPFLLERLDSLGLIPLAYLNRMPARGHLSLQGQGEIVARISEIVTQDYGNLIALPVRSNVAVHALSHVFGHVLKRGYPQFVLSGLDVARESTIPHRRFLESRQIAATRWLAPVLRILAIAQTSPVDYN